MAPERPAAVTVVAILNFVFGGLGLLGSCVTGLGLIGMAILVQNAPKPAAGGLDPLGEIQGAFTSIPGYIPIMITLLVLGLIFQIILIVSGVGLLGMKGWGRILAMVYAIATILTTAGGAIYNLAIVNPAMEKWNAQFQAKIADMQKKQGRPGMPPPPPAGGQVQSTIITIGTALVSIVYSIVILVLLNLPDVRAAFSGKRQSRDDDRDLDDEDEDEENDRRRRRRRDDDDRFTR